MNNPSLIVGDTIIADVLGQKLWMELIDNPINGVYTFRFITDPTLESSTDLLVLEPAANENDFSPIVERFNFAHEGLKFPKIRLETDSGIPIKLYRAGPKAAIPGIIQILWGHDENWTGFITREGKLVWARQAKATPELANELTTTLKFFRDFPEKAAKFYASQTNTCCFCSRPLEEAYSVEHGYGPECAMKYGLPHGQNGTHIPTLGEVMTAHKEIKKVKVT